VWRGPAGFCLETGDQAYQLSCTNLINAAALGSWDVARAIEGLDPTTIPGRNLAKGSYFSIPGKSPFHALIYPMPQVGSLGIHSVQDLGGGIRFGPNMDWVDQIDYTVDPDLRPVFEADIRRYWPDLPQNCLTPDGAGIRPRIWGPGQPKQEFLFQTEADHGMPNLIQLFGFESPGLTSCLAIGRAVGAMLDG
jgi:L-2-hydroxyglutarate oxidase LhgO